MKASQILKIAEQFQIIVKKQRQVKSCMHKGCQIKDGLTQVLWADGRARAIFCNKHLGPWKKENERDVVWEKPYDSKTH
jgi:hypothetical protein